MGAAHTADDNLVSSFFIRSIKRRGGYPYQQLRSLFFKLFLLKLCFDRVAEILTCLGHDILYYGPSHYPDIFFIRKPKK